MYDEIRAALAQDTELVTMLQNALDDTCAPDTTLHTLTVDFGYFITQRTTNNSTTADAAGVDEPAEAGLYTPGLLEVDWYELLNIPTVFDTTDLRIMRRFVDIGGEANTATLAATYGKTAMFYNTKSTALARKVIAASHCPTPPKDLNAQFWPVLFTGRHINTHFHWKLRPELFAALQRIDLAQFPLYEPEKLPTQPYTTADFLADVFLD
jgi:hypothetical protein